MTSVAFSSAIETAYFQSAPATAKRPRGESYPEIVPAVHIPLGVVPRPHIGETRVPVRVPDEVPPLVNALLVRVVVAVVRIEEVPVLADLVLDVDQLDLEIVQLPAMGMLGWIVDVVWVLLEVRGRGHCVCLFVYLLFVICYLFICVSVDGQAGRCFYSLHQTAVFYSTWKLQCWLVTSFLTSASRLETGFCPSGNRLLSEGNRLLLLLAGGKPH